MRYEKIENVIILLFSFTNNLTIHQLAISLVTLRLLTKQYGLLV